MPRAAYAYASREAPEAPVECSGDPGKEKAPTTLSELEEESRVDPYDAEVRTFQELQRHYAGLYTPEALLDYWQHTCRPYLQGFFEGEWVAGAKRHVIAGPRLCWQRGRVTIIEATNRSSFTMALDGSVYSARLEDGGSRLVFSDGEVWTRVVEAEPEEERPYSAGQQVKYFSTSAKKWILATVKSRNQDGTYDLDIKKHAKPQQMRPALSKQAPAEDPAAVARWKMQLPRALAEWAAGDQKVFDELLAARIMASPHADIEVVVHDMLQDAKDMAPAVGLRPQELEEALNEVKKITKAFMEADETLSKQVKRPVAEAGPPKNS